MQRKDFDKLGRVFSQVYPESRFGGFTERDGTIAFYSRVNALIQRECHVLEIGCGRGGHQEDTVAYRRELRVLRGKCSLVTGIDVDPRAVANPYVDRFLLLKGQEWPLPDASVDLAVADYVLEHVSDPEAFFSECQRVVKENGILCIRTTNKRGYVATIARLTPRDWQSILLSVAQGGRKHEDVFDTEYQANTVKKLKSLLSSHGFQEHCVYTHESEPAYFEFSKVLFRIVARWHRISPACLRNTICAFARKDAGRKEWGSEVEKEIE